MRSQNAREPCTNRKRSLCSLLFCRRSQIGKCNASDQAAYRRNTFRTFRNKNCTCLLRHSQLHEAELLVSELTTQLGGRLKAALGHSGLPSSPPLHPRLSNPWCCAVVLSIFGFNCTRSSTAKDTVCGSIVLPPQWNPSLVQLV